MYREFAKFLRTSAPAANAFAVLTLVVWIVKAVWLDDLPPLFPKAFELGKVFEGILSAIIAGWIFYLFFALFPAFRERSVISPYIQVRVSGIVGDCKALLGELETSTNSKLPFETVSKGDIDAALKKINLHSTVSIILSNTMKQANWLEFFRIRRERTREKSREIMVQSRFLEPSLIILLMNVHDSVFFLVTESIQMLPLNNSDFSFLTQNLYRYVIDCQKLAAWHDHNLVPPANPILS